MNCTNCKSDRIISITGKCDDCIITYKNKTHEGYVPDDLNINSGEDYIEFDYCAECGLIQDMFPISEDNINECCNLR